MSGIPTTAITSSFFEPGERPSAGGGPDMKLTVSRAKPQVTTLYTAFVKHQYLISMVGILQCICSTTTPGAVRITACEGESALGSRARASGNSGLGVHLAHVLGPLVPL